MTDFKKANQRRYIEQTQLQLVAAGKRLAELRTRKSRMREEDQLFLLRRGQQAERQVRREGLLVAAYRDVRTRLRVLPLRQDQVTRKRKPVSRAGRRARALCQRLQGKSVSSRRAARDQCRFRSPVRDDGHGRRHQEPRAVLAPRRRDNPDRQYTPAQMKSPRECPRHRAP